MNLSGLLPLIDAIPEYRRLVESLTTSLQPVTPLAEYGSLCLPESVSPFFVAALQRQWTGPILVIASRPERSRRLYDEIRIWSQAPERIQYFPAPEALFYDRVPWERETIRCRLAVLSVLTNGSTDCRSEATGTRGGVSSHLSNRIIVASAWGMMTRTVPPRHFRRGTRCLRCGEVIPPRKLMEWLMRFGYEPSTVVEEPGTFTRRGGIVDIFSPHDTKPVRLEFFGDEIESLRSFDPATQRSEALTDSIAIVPASEALPSYGPQAARILRELSVAETKHLSRQRREEEIALLAEGRPFRGVEHYLPYLYAKPGMLLDYLPDDALIVVDDMFALEAASRALENQAIALRADLVEAKELHPDALVPYFTWDEFNRALRQHRSISAAYESQDVGCYFPETTFRTIPRHGSRLSEALDDLLQRKKTGARVIVISRQSQRLSGMLQERGITAVPQDELVDLPPRGTLTLIHGSLVEGVLLSTSREDGDGGVMDVCSLYTDAEIFGWARPHRRRVQKRRPVSPEAFFADLSIGDFVVHFEHGIAIYQGIVHKSVGGSVEREYLELEYAAGDHLYVPVQQIDRVSRYVGAGDRSPSLHRLGTAEWSQVRERARKAIENIAQDLLEVYAAREVVRGHAFQPDTPWQADLESSFPYEETEDQTRAIYEVKSDMERPKPMDRLICGDVGYGKTEVALRAAFKAVMDGKQVAVLVPTTILAQQHYLTFQQRLDPFPIRVEMLSRFRSRKEQRLILEDMRTGKLDIVIGTHRLISKDVTFKDLGLLIIDEEQRFGVKHKERLKKMRSEVDVLTMTATPIPRTLHLSLSGVRDMSTIDTPPEQRLPIRTFVAEYDETLIRKAILRERDRGGQVFFVHNRVQEIERVANRLQEIVPEASLEVAHGQMDEGQLGRVMLEFSSGQYDVLVCTTIIESGLDIPNVNTIIIDQADSFGLAQLYQLRGRVGRSVNQAYAYLFYDKHVGLSLPSQKRLEAILEASELGAGFRVAMRDLEIRGAGEILGTQQHGHIAAVGFDLYCRLLAKAIQDLREGGDDLQHVPRALLGDAAQREPQDLGATIDLPLSAYLPSSYVEDAALRLSLYRRLAKLSELEEIDGVVEEFRDRFGPLPPVVDNLMYMLRLKVLADRAGVRSIAAERDFVVIRFPDNMRAPQPLIGDRRIRRKRSQIKVPRDADWRERLVSTLATLAALPLPKTAKP